MMLTYLCVFQQLISTITLYLHKNGLLWHLSKHYHFIGSRGLTRFQSILKPNFSKVQNLTDKLGLLFISPSIALRKIENSHLAS